MPVKRNVSDVRLALKKDTRYIRLKELFDTLPVYSMPVEQYQKDIDMYHKTRPVRNLNPTSGNFVDKLIHANIEDQGTRSRVVAIVMECIRAITTLEAAIDRFKDYVLVAYSEELKVVRTKEERLMIIKAVLSVFTKYVDSVKTLKECCEVLIKDIDQAAWSLKLTVQAYEIHSKRETVI